MVKSKHNQHHLHHSDPYFFIFPFKNIYWSTFNQRKLNCIIHFDFDFPKLASIENNFLPHLKSTGLHYPHHFNFEFCIIATFEITILVAIRKCNQTRYPIIHHLQNFVQLLLISDNDNVCTGVACHIFNLEELIIIIKIPSKLEVAPPPKCGVGDG